MEGITVFRPGTGSKLSFRSRTNLCPKRKLSRFSLAPFHCKPLKIVPLKANATLTFNDQLSTRKFEKLSTSDWTHQFHNVSLDVSEVDALRTEFNTLKPIIKNKFKSLEAKERILMIYSLVSLGVAYHFENEIFETLNESFEKIEQILDGEEDLYTVSIIFWVFRTYGHYISSDVFRRFKGNNVNFKESLTEDAKGMLSLYEAAHLGTPKEYIMDEALSFTTSHLESLAASETCPPHLLKRIRSALTLSQHWNMKVLVQVEYIAFYGHVKDHDEMLLKFAKLNFKFLKLQYIQELKMVTKWYKELEFESTLPPYFRDRIVEHHFFVQAVFLEPQLSHARILLIQYFTGLAILDDTFDRYASLPEAEGLANSMERWAFDHTMDKQPDYLKFVLKFLLDIFEEFERELRPEGRSYSVNAAKEEFKILVKANFDLTKWALAAQVPSFDEYMKVGETEITVCATLAGMFMSMANINAKDAYEWLKSRPKIVKNLSIKGRLMNDVTGFKDDMSRGYVTNAVNCYMKQYGVTEEEASRELNKMVAEADKILNEEFLTTVGVEHRVLEATMDLARMITVSYNGDEGFTNPRGRIYDNMASMFVDQINT